LAPGPIVATDTAFSSNRFALAHQVHKFDLQVELTEAVMNQLLPTQLLKSSHPVMLAPMDVGARVASRTDVSTSFIEGFRNDS
jgi:hypothetical protein